jgi:hypothetical protein
VGWASFRAWPTANFPMPSTYQSRRAPSAKDAAWLESRLSLIRMIIHKRDYTVKGSLSFVNIVAGGELKTINFKRVGPRQEISGPFVAKANSIDQMLIVSTWNGIPPLIDGEQKQPCDACLAECFLCKGSGKQNCTEQYCGGTGIQHLPSTHYQDDQSGIAHCHGCPTCPTCQGTKITNCRGCQGTGKRSTGKKDQSITEYKQSNLCPKCQGRQYQSREVPVNVMEFCSGMVGGMIELGPVVAFSLQPTSDSPAKRTKIIYDCKENLEGEPMSILLAGTQTPCEAFMLGGFCQERL